MSFGNSESSDFTGQGFPFGIIILICEQFAYCHKLR